MEKDTIIVEIYTNDELCGPCQHNAEDVGGDTICIIAPLTEKYPWNQKLNLNDQGEPLRCHWCIQNCGAQDKIDFMFSALKEYELEEVNFKNCSTCANWDEERSISGERNGTCSELCITTSETFFCRKHDDGEQ
jgi:hypothetical protein